MTPLLTAALVLTHAAVSAAPAGHTAPVVSPASVPGYVPALTVLDDVLRLPQGEAPIVEPGRVCYAPAAHLRLTMALQLAQPLSDERARVAWLYGWQASSEQSAKLFDGERSARMKAEAAVAALDVRLLATERADNWATLRSIIVGLGVFGLGGVTGFVLGAK